MNLLYLAHRIPYPPDKGDKLRSFKQIEYLSRRHRVWCLCFLDDPSDGKAIAPLRAHCVELAVVPLNRPAAAARGGVSLLRGQSLTEGFYHHPSMVAVLRQWSDRVAFDAVLALSSSMAGYALRVSAPRRVLDLCDIDSEKWRAYGRFSRVPWRWLYELESRRLHRAERSACTAFDAVLLISEAEARLLSGNGAPERVHVVGNGVSLPTLGSLTCASAFEPAQTAKPCHIGFVGVMNYRPNVDAVCWFVREIWPIVLGAYPNSLFRIVGRSPTRKVRRLARAEGVRVVGEVQEVGQELRRFDVSVAPLRIARGLQNKVLEALAYAKPVVLTPAAAEGLQARNGEHFLVAGGAAAFAERVIQLLGDEALRGRIGQAGRAYVAAHHRWEEELSKLEDIVTRRCAFSLPHASHKPQLSGGQAAHSKQQPAVAKP